MEPTSLPPLPVLTTKRLQLQQLLPDDAEAIYALRSNPSVNKYIDRVPCNTIEEALSFISTVTEFIQHHKGFYWKIINQQNNDFIGTICLFKFDQQNNSCEIGYELLPCFQGNGFMKEAVSEVMQFAFIHLNSKEINAFVHPDNAKSITLLSAFGFLLNNKSEGSFIGYSLIKKP